MEPAQRERSLALSTERMVAIFRIIGGLAGIVLTVTDVVVHPVLERNLELATLGFLAVLGAFTLVWLARTDPDEATLRRYMTVTWVLDAVILLVQSPLHSFVALEAPSPALLVPLLGAVRFGYGAAVVGTVGVAIAYGVRGWLAVSVYDLPFGIDPTVVTVLLAGIIGLITAHLFTSARAGRARADEATKVAEEATARSEAVHRVLIDGVGGGVGPVVQRLAATVAEILGAAGVRISIADELGVQVVGSCGSFDGGPSGGEMVGVEHPVMYGDMPLGTVEVAGPRRMENELAAIAGQVGLAVHAARLLDHEASLASRYRAVDLMRSNFVSLTSHELRTPTTVIIGAVETLRTLGDDLAPDEHKAMIGLIARQGERLSQLVEDLLTVGRTDAGALSFKPRYVPVTEVVAAVEKSVEQAMEVSDSEMTMWVDPVRAAHVLHNLVENAVEHGVQPFRVSWTAADGVGYVRVSDAGGGIPAEEHEHVFDRFVQLQSIQHHSHGTGLGLGISRDLMRAMGGDVWIDADAPTTTFVMTVPLQPASQPAS